VLQVNRNQANNLNSNESIGRKIKSFSYHVKEEKNEILKSNKQPKKSDNDQKKENSSKNVISDSYVFKKPIFKDNFCKICIDNKFTDKLNNKIYCPADDEIANSFSELKNLKKIMVAEGTQYSQRNNRNNSNNSNVYIT